LQSIPFIVSPAMGPEERHLYRQVQAERLDRIKQAHLERNTLISDNLANMKLKAQLTEKSRDVIRETGDVHNEFENQARAIEVLSDNEVNLMLEKTYSPEELPDYASMPTFGMLRLCTAAAVISWCALFMSVCQPSG